MCFFMRKGEKLMDHEIVTKYEQIMKDSIMLSMGMDHPKTLKEIACDLIQNHEEQYLNINYAYLKVKHEIVGA